MEMPKLVDTSIYKDRVKPFGLNSPERWPPNVCATVRIREFDSSGGRIELYKRTFSFVL